MGDSSRGDPESPLTWTTRSVKQLAEGADRAGAPVQPGDRWRQLRRGGYTLQSNAKAAEGRQHPERDAQFRYIAAQAREHQAAGQPVISVDAKKKEQVGNYGQDGRDWRPQGQPGSGPQPRLPGQGRPARDPLRDLRRAGQRRVRQRRHRREHRRAGGGVGPPLVDLAGKDAYPDATRLLVTCDAGGSNGYRNRAWKAGLAALAQETGLEITVCHFPPGTSKWNKIEHRLFCQITLAWRGRPLTSYDVIINTIGAVTTRTGLTATAVLDENAYPTGTEISDEQMKDIEDRCLTRHGFHGEWNYTMLPRPPAPAPQPAPARPPGRPGRPEQPRPHRQPPRTSPPWPPPSDSLGRRPRAAAATWPAAGPPARTPGPARPASSASTPACSPPSAATASA